MRRTFSRTRFSRNLANGGLVHHRSAITAADKLAAPGTITSSDVNEAGSVLTNAQRNYAVSAFNRWGSTLSTSPGNRTPTLNHAIRLAFSAVTGADGYDIFLSTDAQPKWVARITEAQRAAGGIISSVGTYAAGGAINSIDIGIDGTGLANNVNPFAVNNAYTPAASGITAIDCQDYEYLDLYVQLSVTDLRSLPTLVLTGFQQNATSNSGADWCQFWTQTVNILTATQQPLEQMYRVTVAGAEGVVFLVDSIAGQAAACDLWYTLE